MNIITCDIAVIGAGLAGLAATHYLYTHGIDVKLFETQNRPGGRVYTIHNTQGQHYDVGAFSFTNNEKHLFSYIKKFNLKYIEHSHIDKEFIFKGKRYYMSDKATCLHDNEQQMTFNDILPYYLKQIDKNDTTSIAESLKKAGASELAIEWINQYSIIGLFGNGIQDISTKAAIQFLKQYEQAQTIYSFKDGNDILPNILANAVSNCLIYNTEIKKIIHNDNSVQLISTCDKHISAKKVICTIPLPNIQKILFVPPLSDTKITAISSIPYTMCNTIILEERISDICTKINGGIFAIAEKPKGWFRNQTLFQKNIYGNTIISFYTTGEEALMNMQLPKIKQYDRAIEGLSHFISTDYAQGLESVFFLEGYSYFPPNTLPFQHEIAKPEGNIHFAGEHTSKKFASMNGAIQSGLRAAEEVLTLLKGISTELIFNNISI
ncbi:MAG TPA: NAD(P)/FAD-dependent oxidoreductase [Candidatus Babeliales bacterium]|jgi:monoamine oxidase|nr:NAD(P)/FAD-dependent oxidoreductase [Candidatus Babeliales bacterium]